MTTKLTTLALLLAIAFTACDKDKEDNEPTAGRGKIGFYTLESVQFMTGRCEIDPANSRLSQTPIVGNEDIISYTMDNASWRVTDAAWQRLNALKDGNALAIKLNDKVVYYFVYKPMYSSSSCDQSITMQLWPKLAGFTAENAVMMTLGYPAPFQGITDRRNTPVLIHELQAQKKLQ